MKFSIKKSGDFKKILTSILILILLLLFLNLYQKEVRNFFYLISSPLQKSLWRVGDRVSNFFETMAGIKNLKKENEDLKSKLREILAENVLFGELKKENETLRQALKIGFKQDFKLILARVTGKDISQDFLIIDKSLKDGISKDSPVINKEKILVGRISEVYNNFSKVMLISNKESTFDGKILAPNLIEDYSSGLDILQQPVGAGQAEIFGVVKGMGNFKILFDLIPQDKEIKKGDFVITTAMGGIYPSGLLVGEIKEVKKTDIEPFQQAKILPLYDIKELEYLFIISEF